MVHKGRTTFLFKRREPEFKRAARLGERELLAGKQVGQDNRGVVREQMGIMGIFHMTNQTGMEII